jgi:hypothetical protein
MILKATDITEMRDLAALLAEQPNEARVTTLVSNIQTANNVLVGKAIAERIKIILGSPSVPSPPPPPSLLQGTFYLICIWFQSYSAVDGFH